MSTHVVSGESAVIFFTLHSPGETAGALCTIFWVHFREDVDNVEMPKENRENNCRS